MMIDTEPAELVYHVQLRRHGARAFAACVGHLHGDLLLPSGLEYTHPVTGLLLDETSVGRRGSLIGATRPVAGSQRPGGRNDVTGGGGWIDPGRAGRRFLSLM